MISLMSLNINLLISAIFFFLRFENQTYLKRKQFKKLIMSNNPKLPQNLHEYIHYLRNLTQPTPHFGNQYLEDSVLTHYLPYFLPKNILKTVEPLFTEIGEKASTEYWTNAKEAERAPPVLQQFSATGERIDIIHTGLGWKSHGKFAPRDGIVALAYEKDTEALKLDEYRRFVQAVVLYLYQPSSGLFGCPLAMTDGAAAVLRNILDTNKTLDDKIRKKLSDAFTRLTSRNPETFITSGQWMTEKMGGSDVSNATETIAVAYKPNKYRLFGYKWFSSATECDMSLALGRIVNYDESRELKPEEIKRIPLSLFFVKTRSSKTGKLNNIEIIRMKDKLGTRQLPTAELLLKGTKATLISEPGKGVKMISHMLNITRVYNASSAVSTMRRFLALLRDYGHRRDVFNSRLNELPLQQEVLANIDVTLSGNLLFYLKTVELLSKYEAGKISKDEGYLLRLFTPILKLFTAKECMRVCSEGVEGFGALGYIETSYIPMLLRDAQVLTIWEGTTNVLAYDVARVFAHEGHAVLEAFIKFFGMNIFNSIVSEGKHEEDVDTRQSYIKLIKAYHEIINDIRKILKNGLKEMAYNLRNLSFGIARITIASLCLDLAVKSGRKVDLEVFNRWVNMKELYQRVGTDKGNLRKLALDLDSNNKARGVGDIDGQGKVRPKI